MRRAHISRRVSADGSSFPERALCGLGRLYKRLRASDYKRVATDRQRLYLPSAKSGVCGGNRIGGLHTATVIPRGFGGGS